MKNIVSFLIGGGSILFFSGVAINNIPVCMIGTVFILCGEIVDIIKGEKEGK